MSEALKGVITGMLIAGVPALVLAFSVRKKTKAETTDLITESAERIILRLEAIITRLEEEKGTHLIEVQELKAEVRRLRQIVRVLGHDPDVDLNTLRRKLGEQNGSS